MYALRKDTLAGIKQSALFLQRSMANQPVSEAAKQLLAYEATSPGLAHAEQEAFKFYYANHVFAMIAAQYGPHDLLPEPVAALARGYVKLASDLSVRVAYYCLLIITREARHMFSNVGATDHIKALHGAPIAHFLKSLHSVGEEGAVNKLRHFPPNTTLGQYVSGMVEAYNYPGVWQGGFGGPKWGLVASTLRALVYGETTPEMFADTAYTLAHNGGPIFDKKMLYASPDRAKIFKVLDVQRAGMVPQLWHTAPALRPAGAEMAAFVAAARKLFPAATEGYVDWYQVCALGALHGPYTKEKAEQIAKHGASPLATAVEKAESAKFWITPHEYVTKVEVEREKAA